MKDKIRLYWWSEVHIQKKKKENYGDLIGKYLVEKISGKEVQWLRANRFYLKNFWKPLYVTVGSILEHIGAHCTVWGSGIIAKDSQVANAHFLAVRGPLSRKRLQELNYTCPEVYGDPALLLPSYFNPKVDKIFKVGIVPHINDYNRTLDLYAKDKDVLVIDFMTNDIEKTTRDILSCEFILSSSLHGLIVSHAYQIPAIQIRLSDKILGDGVKYHDYFMSVNLEPYQPLPMEVALKEEELIMLVKNHKKSLPSLEKIQEIQKQLIEVCPFK